VPFFCENPIDAMNGCLGPVHFETGLSGVSNKSAGSTLLMQRPLIG
jgi:hypothetical protein